VLVYGGLAAALWPSPLLGLVHAESSAVVAAATFFVTGFLALGAYAAGRRPPEVLRRSLVLAALPLALLTISLAWRANCGYPQGLALYLLFVTPSVALAVALTWALSGRPGSYPRTAFVGIGLVLAVVPVLLGPGLHPQLYSYNPVWGGFLGPLYDEELAIRPGLFAHRALVLLWAAWLVALGTWRRERRGARAGAVLGGAIGVAYLCAPALGIVTTYTTIERRLPARAELGPFVLHYDPSALPAHDVRAAGETLRYRHAVFTGILGVAPAEPVHVYLYPDPGSRAALTGARYTSVSPVWLRRPQMHLLQHEATPDNLAHELAHVFAREFGAPVLRASPAVGLVEGLAVALEPPSGLPAPAEQVAASRSLAPADAGRLSDGPAAAVAAAMSPLGFWTGRGAVSYTTAGAFVGWLLDRYGAAPLRRAYRTGDLAAAYGRPAEVLAGDWARDIARLAVGEDALALAAWRFAQPSLLERRCPHHVPRERRLVRRAGRALAEGDVEEARRLYGAALRHAPNYLPAVLGRASASLGAGAPAGAVAARLADVAADTADAGLLTLLGDARRMDGDDAGARRAYAGASAALPPFAHEARAALRARSGLPTESIRHMHTADPHTAALALEEIAGASPAAWSVAAARWAEAGEPERALAAVRRLPPAGDAGGAALRLSFAAHHARLAGRPADAARDAAGAAAAWRAAGAAATALRMEDRAAEARWVGSGL